MTTRPLQGFISVLAIVLLAACSGSRPPPTAAIQEQAYTYGTSGVFPKPEQAGLRAAATLRLSRNSRRTYLAAIRALLAFDLRAQLPALRCPTLVIAGDRDTTVALAAKEEQQRLIPGAQLVVVADSGHATPYDQADLFNQKVMDFIQKHEL